MKVADIQRFCMHDGPGIRTVVFAKGCPLCCKWCHNPETQKNLPTLLYYPVKCIACGRCTSCANGVHEMLEQHMLNREKCGACGLCVEKCPTGALELCGKEMSCAAILHEVLRDQPFYSTGGGVTFSGGEPFVWGDDLVAMLAACKAQGVGTAVETCGYTSPALLEQAAPYTDLFLWDIKDTDEERHFAGTGVSLKPILQNLQMVDCLGAKTRLRCILLAGVNTCHRHYRDLARIAASLHHCEGVEFLPYHAYGGAKANAAGLSYEMHPEWIPTDVQMQEAKDCLMAMGMTVL